MQREENSGIPRERIVTGEVNNTLQHLVCGICFDILWKPVSCSKCQANFWEGCIARWLSSSGSSGHPVNSCPNRCIYRKANSPPILKNLLSELRIFCGYKENGCNQIITYDGLERHETSCPFQPENCSGCEKVFLLHERQLHEQACDLVKIPCEVCEKVFTRKEFKDHNELNCLKAVFKETTAKYEELFQLFKNLNQQNNELKQEVQKIKIDQKQDMQKIEKELKQEIKDIGEFLPGVCNKGHKPTSKVLITVPSRGLRHPQKCSVCPVCTNPSKSQSHV